MDNLLIFGGTFDPIHYGHLHAAISVQDFFHFDRFAFLPCKLPVIDKQSLTTSSQHRLAMLNLALAPQPKHYHFYIDLREITRDLPSYTVITLKALRQETGKSKPITLLLGLDAFYQLPHWHQWRQLIKLANLLVINRKGSEETKMPEEVKTLLRAHETADPKTLLKMPHGLIARFDAGDYDISSTAVRNSLMAKKPANNLLPENVRHYIIENKLYYFE